jgi:hypothetical protein
MGLLYLVQLPLLVFLLSRRFGGFDDFRGAFVLLMAPLAVIWSAWYIPQVYSLTLFLTAFLARLPVATDTATCGRRVWPWGRRHLDGADYCGSLDL